MRYWLSSKRMTVYVETDNSGAIIKAPPITSKFIGQPIDNLKRWMSRQEDFKWEIISYKENK